MYRLLTLLTLIALLPGLPAAAAPQPDEFIQVDADAWHFSGAQSGSRYIPFGANFVLDEKRYLNLFGPDYDAPKYTAILDACAEMKINCLKLFLPIHAVLPDPQPFENAQIAPGYLDQLDAFLDACKARHIRAIVALTSWGGNGVRWWQEGGQYYGRMPEQGNEAHDSLRILTDFWRQLGLRFKDNPTIFAFTPAVEWTFPCTNLTWQHGYKPVLDTAAGRYYWRAWLRARHQSLANLNAAWGASHPAFEEIPLPDYSYDEAKGAYASPEAMILDYQDFREWSTMRYLRPQLKAIRAAAPKHLVTISNQMRSWNLWRGAAQHFLGTTPIEQKEWVDFVTLHANFRQEDLPAEITPEEVVREVRGLLCFAAAGKPMPILLEEYSFACPVPERVARMQEAIVSGTQGYASGWLSWYLMYPKDAAVGADSRTKGHESSWLSADLNKSPWGRKATDLFDRLAAPGATDRVPPQQEIILDRATCLVPHKSTPLLELMIGEAEWRPTAFIVDRCRYHLLELEVKE